MGLRFPIDDGTEIDGDEQLLHVLELGVIAGHDVEEAVGLLVTLRAEADLAEEMVCVADLALHGGQVEGTAAVQLGDVVPLELQVAEAEVEANLGDEVLL